MKKISKWFPVVIFMLHFQLFGQGAGTLDPTFNGTGFKVYDKDNVDLYQDVKVQSDGKILTVGTSYTPTWSAGIELTRYLTNGDFDPGFGTGGHAGFTMNVETGAYKILLRNNGKILVAGYTTDYTNWWTLLLQFNSDGTLDNTFGTNGVIQLNLSQGEEMFYAVSALPDGGFLACGYAQNQDYKNVPIVVKFDAAGNQDMAFGSNGVASVPVTESDNDFSAVGVQSDGKIMAAGHISNGLSWYSLLVARFDNAGVLDPSYGTAGVINLNLGNVDDEFFDMVITPDDQAILTGFVVSQLDLYYHMLVMKFDNGGWPSISFGLGGYQIVGEVPYSFGDAMAVQDDGKILIAGCTGNQPPANNDWAIWRFTADGFPDPDFGTNGLVTTEFFGNADEALGIALYQEKIVVAGKVRNASNQLDFAVARYQNGPSVSVPEVASIEDFVVLSNPSLPRDGVSFSLSMQQEQTVGLEICNVTGSVVCSKNLGVLSAGAHSFHHIFAGTLAPGMYCMKLTGPQGTLTTKKLLVAN